MAEQIVGLRELQKALKELSPQKQQNAIRNAVRAAIKPTKEAAENLAPKGDEAHKTYRGRWVAPGFLSRNINVNTSVSRDGTRIYATVGTTKEAFYGRQFLEVGTRYIKQVQWLRPAYEATRYKMRRIFQIELRKKIIAQAKKVKKPRRVRR